MNSVNNFEFNPLVSVAIPCYNSADTVSETLDSILEQSYKNIEIIVVDDGSTDNTLDVLKSYGSKIVVIVKENGGLASARNAGCRYAKGKYIALVDSDDLCVYDRIAIQVSYMEKNHEIVMCSSDFSAFDRNGVVAGSYIKSYYSRVAETEGGVAGIYPFHEDIILDGRKIDIYSGSVYEQMALGSFVHPPTVFFRKSVLDECGLFDENIVNCCDYDWFVRVSRIGKIGYINCPLLNYRISDRQMSNYRNRLQIALDIVSVMEKTIANDPILFAHNRKVFRRHLGVGYLGVANALVDNNYSFKAITALFRSISLGVFHLQSVKVILKVVIPLWVLNWLRHGRRSPKV